MSDDRTDDHQPTPPANAPSYAHLKVIRDTATRMEHGHRKYGGALEPGNGRDHLQDAYEEALDLCAYLANEILEREQAPRPPRSGPAQEARSRLGGQQ